MANPIRVTRLKRIPKDHCPESIVSCSSFGSLPVAMYGSGNNNVPIQESMVSHRAEMHPSLEILTARFSDRVYNHDRFKHRIRWSCYKENDLPMKRHHLSVASKNMYATTTTANE
jgi:hypothetical protein